MAEPELIMINRRFLVHSATASAVSTLLSACGPGGIGDGDSNESYASAVRRIWHATPQGGQNAEHVQRELVRFATLAPSSHNTQCWKFRIAPQSISIRPDLSRRCPAVDPDDHHLFVSLGCAAENLVQAASAHGFQGIAQFGTENAGSIQVLLEARKPFVSDLFNAIQERQCTRGEFNGASLSSTDLTLLEKAGTGPGVHVILLSEKPAIEKVLEYVVAGNTAQMQDAAFVRELKTWIRFGAREAVASGDGLYSVSSGSPSLPRWAGSRLFDMMFTSERENEKYVRHIRSSSGIAIFVAQFADRAHWVEVGRCYQRFALQATALGIRNAMLNQPVEVAGLRPQFAAAMGLEGRRPDLVVRFGRGPKMPSSLRRPVDAVLA